MKKIFVDTNIVIDLLLERNPFFEEATLLFSLADKKKVEISISSLTIATTSYFISKRMSPNETRTILQKLRLILTILPLDDKIIGLALNDNCFSDFEDSLQYFTAIENNKDFIITRNLKDFKNSKIPVLTAKQFLEIVE